MSDEPKKEHLDPDFILFDRWLEEFRDEHDRAAVILGAARLDLALRHLLSALLLPASSGTDELLDTERPLSSFSSRINAAYRLGLIDRQFARALHLVRKIRNDFAHEAVGASLDSGAHRDRVRELAAPFLSAQGFSEYRERAFPKATHSSQVFRAALSILVIRLNGALTAVVPVTDSTAYSMVPPVWASEALAKEATKNAG